MPKNQNTQKIETPNPNSNSFSNLYSNPYPKPIGFLGAYVWQIFHLIFH